jgi:hypothetical protein
MQANLQRACKKCMSRLRESYNKEIPSIKKEHICEEDEFFLKKESW